ncbi:hypothetical protein GIB67_033389 [Kingdonia uniflora]|uniref:Uncharacterized protein n=1 Tax=Kingdonia uniflora TaxID=39325 RepID=A0A7J7LU41_9MAGN|nr:hypothetical protein GIB67_033389 [Kingdonia uniflora]
MLVDAKELKSVRNLVCVNIDHSVRQAPKGNNLGNFQFILYKENQKVRCSSHFPQCKAQSALVRSCMDKLLSNLYEKPTPLKEMIESSVYTLSP